MPKVYVESYGCSSNLADREIAVGVLKREGFILSKSPKESDLNIIFTCTVKLPTVSRMMSRIQYLTSLEKPLIVAGCLPKVRREIVERINPNASLISPDQVEKIREAALAAIKNKKVIFLDDLKRPKLGLPRCRVNPVVAIVQVGRGCLSNCSFCCEPYKGKLFSYPSNRIVEEVERSIEEGCKEVWLTSLDNGCYGFDIGTNLAKLLEEVCRIDKKFFVRVGMANPLHVRKILEELLNSYKDEKVYKFLHIPVQSASDRILRLMNRGYTRKDFLEIVKRFREEFPLSTISTDLIVGFPEETATDFRKTLDLVEKIRPDIVNISKFGSHHNTLAAFMKQLSRRTIDKRTKKLFQTVRKTQMKSNRKWVGWKGEILVDEMGKGRTWVGRNFAYKPIVVKSRKKLLGKFIEVKVVDCRTNYLLGECKI